MEGDPKTTFRWLAGTSIAPVLYEIVFSGYGAMESLSWAHS